MKGLWSWLISEAKDKGFLIVILLGGLYLITQRYDNCNNELISNLKEQNKMLIQVISRNNVAFDQHSEILINFSKLMEEQSNK